MIIAYSENIDVILACRGICERYRSDKKRYHIGVKRCTSCDVYMQTLDAQCPCCNTVLRSKRKSKLKNTT